MHFYVHQMQIMLYATNVQDLFVTYTIIQRVYNQQWNVSFYVTMLRFLKF